MGDIYKGDPAEISEPDGHVPVEWPSWPKIVRAQPPPEYEPFPKESSNFPGVDFEFDDDGLPVEVSFNGETFKVTAEVLEIKAADFFRNRLVLNSAGAVAGVHFDNQVAQGLFDSMGMRYVYGLSQNLEPKLRNEFLVAIYARMRRGDSMDFEGPIVLKRGEEGRIDDGACTKMMSSVMTDMHAWVRELTDRDVPIRVHNVSVLEGPKWNVRRVVIGDVIKGEPTDQWAAELEVIALMEFVSTQFGIKDVEDVTILNLSTADEDVGDGRWVPRFREGPTSQGFAMRGRRKGTAVVYNCIRESAWQETDGAEGDSWVIRGAPRWVETYKQVRTSTHEAMHVLDPYLDFASSAQAEAFAMTAELGFSFPESVVNLRFIYDFHDTVTRDTIIQLFSGDANAYQKVYVYCVSATLFCNLYEKLGPQRFFEMYGFLTGGKKVTVGLEASGSPAVGSPFDRVRGVPNRAVRGNIRNAIACALGGRGDSLQEADRLIDDYLAEVNQLLY